MGQDYSARTLVLSKRVKNYWHKSGQSEQMSLKVWARTSDDEDVRDWLNLKSPSSNKLVKSRTETADKKKR